MIARFRGQCAKCNKWIEAGEECNYNSAIKRIEHHECPADLFSQDEAAETAVRLGFVDAGELDGWHSGREDVGG